MLLTTEQTLIPCLKEMGKDFIKFMVLVVVIYMGFLTTFSLIGRKTYPFKDVCANRSGFLPFQSIFCRLRSQKRVSAPETQRNFPKWRIWADICHRWSGS